MKLFLDSSVYAKRFIEEAGSKETEELCAAATSLGLSAICVPEVISALNRRVREKRLSRPDYVHVKQHLSEEVRDADIVNITPDVVQLAIRILETSPIRAMDALHLACAMAWAADLFASADERQIAAAKKTGLKARNI